MIVNAVNSLLKSLRRQQEGVTQQTDRQPIAAKTLGHTPSTATNMKAPALQQPLGPGLPPGAVPPPTVQQVDRRDYASENFITVTVMVIFGIYLWAAVMTDEASMMAIFAVGFLGIGLSGLLACALMKKGGDRALRVDGRLDSIGGQLAEIKARRLCDDIASTIKDIRGLLPSNDRGAEDYVRYVLGGVRVECDEFLAKTNTNPAPASTQIEEVRVWRNFAYYGMVRLFLVHWVKRDSDGACVWFLRHPTCQAPVLAWGAFSRGLPDSMKAKPKYSWIRNVDSMVETLGRSQPPQGAGTIV